ncbi:uncharacterized protein Tco025E_09291 [Trypanosoma conorhini]|uniref:Uncharacterized protein n=1 Tax=Trypanosoma conorhini TaxID=83891 RepID=A0A3R7N0Q9_9TRYP|nr:uncharacterized protein Tco025E_09291 [Trypanosoma conorhini]RNE98101.1 hypothetical protein Tco025E_09291 [Trypanosoma conorhini]
MSRVQLIFGFNSFRLIFRGLKKEGRRRGAARFATTSRCSCCFIAFAPRVPQGLSTRPPHLSPAALLQPILLSGPARAAAGRSLSLSGRGRGTGSITRKEGSQEPATRPVDSLSAAVSGFGRRRVQEARNKCS